MPQQEFSPTRTHATWKPRVFDNDLAIFECPSCHQVHIGVTDGSDVEWTGTGRSLVAELPYGRSEAPFCDRCGTRMEPMPMIDVADLPPEFELDFQFRGGFNSNCVKIKWFSKDRELRPQWMAVKTFTAYQVKYVPRKEVSPRSRSPSPTRTPTATAIQRPLRRVHVPLQIRACAPTATWPGWALCAPVSTASKRMPRCCASFTNCRERRIGQHRSIAPRGFGPGLFCIFSAEYPIVARPSDLHP
jgi:hypothetical protein